jgi:hypothetical protein
MRPTDCTVHKLDPRLFSRGGFVKRALAVQFAEEERKVFAGQQDRTTVR